MAISTLRLRHLAARIFLLCGSIRISGAVSVQHRKAPILANINDTAVTLPCDFTTSSYEIPQITWHHEIHGERRKIMQYNIHNRLLSYGEFADRVARGDRGALVLLRPRPRDSGNYTCEVEVDTDDTSWVRTTVTLNITGEVPPPTVRPSPSDVTEKQNGGLLFQVAIFWILPVICSFLLVRKGFNVCRQTREKTPGKKIHRDLLGIAQRPVVVVLVIALCFFFTATICTAAALSGTTPEVTNYYSRVGLGTGLVGTLLLIAALVWLCVRPKLFRKKPARALDAEAGNTELNQSTLSMEETFHDAKADPSAIVMSPQMRDTKIKPEESNSLLPHTAAVKVEKTEPEVKTLHTPENEIVTGMTAMTYKDIFITTKSGVYQFDLSKSTWHPHPLRRKEDLFAITKSKNDLLITAIKKTPKKKDSSLVLRVKTAEEKVYKIRLESNSTITWALTSRDEKYVYLAVTNPAMVVKKSIENKKEIKFSVGLLKNPTCIIQNSSGQLVVADSHKHDLLVFEEDGDFVTSMKISVPKKMEDEMKGCNKLALGSDGRVYATGLNSKHILVFSPDFRFERLIPTKPVGSLTISSLMVLNDSLYVAHEDCIRVHPLKSHSSMNDD
ncbi:uncharacterized protein LOC135462821 [Liolophura sinensis]|uniref:uncharacterized protein LOC135462821 n=1 Tax=Liolophura sinensis TaxID=3198878 RepID=UPI0031596500